MNLMRPLERIDKIIDLVRTLICKYPDKSFGQVMESVFLLLGEKFINEYIQGNVTRLDYIQDLVDGTHDTEEDEETKNIKNIMNNVLDYVKELEKKETRVHPMLVEDDVFEAVLRFMIDIPDEKKLPIHESPYVKDQICDLLLKIWKETYTDWRFGQMLGNTCFDRFFSPNFKKHIYWLLFDIPDNKVLEILIMYVNSGFQFNNETGKLKFEMYSELIKDKVWTNKHNTIIEIENYVQDMVQDYEKRILNKDDDV